MAGEELNAGAGVLLHRLRQFCLACSCNHESHAGCAPPEHAAKQELFPRAPRSRIGSDAFKKVTEAVEHRLLVMLAIASGIGFLAGLANRR